MTKTAPQEGRNFVKKCVPIWQSIFFETQDIVSKPPIIGQKTQYIGG